MSFVLLGILNSQALSGAGVAYRLQTLGGSGEDSGESVAIDLDGNIYVLGYTTSTAASNDDFLLAKYDSSGTIQWQKTLGGSVFGEGYSVAIDSSNNIYAFGRINNLSGAFKDAFLLAKYDSSGSIQWQR